MGGFARHHTVRERVSAAWQAIASAVRASRNTLGLRKAVMPPRSPSLSADDVRQCYRTVLGRDPESDAVVEKHVHGGTSLWSLVEQMVRSPEHLSHVSLSGPTSLLKFRDTGYPILGLTEYQRASCLFHNYEALRAGLRKDAFCTLLNGPLCLLAGRQADYDFEITLSLFEDYLEEGELAFWLRVNGTRLCVVCLTIGPADAFNLGTGSVFLVSRVQGVRGTGDLARQVSKAFGEITPPHLLLCAIQGAASALKINWMLGAHQEALRSYEVSSGKELHSSYDALFESLGSTRLPGGLHAVALPRRERPLQEIAQARRRRTRVKRAAKQEIINAVRRRWAEMMPDQKAPPGPLPIPTNDVEPIDAPACSEHFASSNCR